MISILKFIFNPYFKEPEPFNFKFFFSYILKAYLLTILGVSLSGILIICFDPYISKLIETKSVLEDFKRFDRNIVKGYGSYAILIVCFIGPFIEEIIFRLPLILKKNAFAVTFSILFYRFSGASLINVSLTELETYLRLVATALIYVISLKLIDEKYLLRLKGNSFRFLFWISAILFGLVHISNNKNINLLYLPLYTLYIIPQIIMGLTLGAVRVNIGFWGALLLHSFFNLISVIFYLIS